MEKRTYEECNSVERFLQKFTRKDLKSVTSFVLQIEGDNLYINSKYELKNFKGSDLIRLLEFAQSNGFKEPSVQILKTYEGNYVEFVQIYSNK